jgi:hypothetical protein
MNTDSSAARPRPAARAEAARAAARRAWPAALAATAVAAAASPALATIVAVLPAVTLFAASDVTLNQTQSDTDIVAFDERQCVLLQKDLRTDEGVIPAGARVSCHFFHFDPVNNGQIRDGKARFSSDVVGVISGSALLDASDGVCGLPGVTYPGPGAEPLRGFEPFQPNDRYQIIDAGRGIHLQTDVPSFSDQLRVVTRCCAGGACPAD